MHVVAVVVTGDPAPDRLDALTPLGDAPLVAHSVRVLARVPGVDHVYVLVPAGSEARVVDALAGMPVTVHGSAADLWAHAAQRPGCTDGDGQITDRACVLVHDAARPLVPPALTAAVVDAVQAGNAVVVPVLPLSDTVKDVDTRGLLHATPDRAGLRIVQTPQGFRGDLRPVLDDPVHPWATVATPAHTVPGDPMAFPVRDVWDLQLAGSTIGAGA
jgi:2-C-methyl-D-erythritol 4-phosphate cytidylyltransferase